MLAVYTYWPLAHAVSTSSPQMRSGHEYTLNRLPCRNTTKVTPKSRASRTARLLGAEIAHTIGARAMIAFCNNSKLARPLNSTM